MTGSRRADLPCGCRARCHLTPADAALGAGAGAARPSCRGRCVDPARAQGCGDAVGCGLCCGTAGSSSSGLAIGLISDDAERGPAGIPRAPSWQWTRRLLLSPESLGFHVVEFRVDEAGTAEAAPGSFDVVAFVLPRSADCFPALLLDALVSCIRPGGLIVVVVTITAGPDDAPPDAHTGRTEPEAVRDHLTASRCRHTHVTVFPPPGGSLPPARAAVTATAPPYQRPPDR